MFDRDWRTPRGTQSLDGARVKPSRSQTLVQKWRDAAPVNRARVEPSRSGRSCKKWREATFTTYVAGQQLALMVLDSPL